MQPLLNIAITAARLAGDIIVRHIEQIDRLKISIKNSNEYFSEVDVKAEQAIMQSIHKAYPDHGFITEESGIHNGDADAVWIIDPLDGTTNFLHGFPFFSVSIALRIKGRIEHGVVYDPMHHECFYASRGEGAKLNERRIRVSKQTQLSAALVGTACPFHQQPHTDKYMQGFTTLLSKSASVRRTGSAALDLAYLAAGRLDGLWGLNLRLWDIAAGTLLVREAGGLICDLQGGENYLKNGDLLAGTPKILKGLMQTLTPVFKSCDA